MNPRSRSTGLRDVLHIPRNVIKSKTSKISVSHLARAKNYKRNCRLFSYQDTYFIAEMYKKINKRIINNQKSNHTKYSSQSNHQYPNKRMVDNLKALVENG